ncbi:MAG: adenosylmethionine decarboxylase [Candidatus Omnitrophota bacterium]
MSTLKKEYGRHYLVELIDCDPLKIKYVEQVREVFLRAAHASEATIVEHFFKQYDPHGVTGIILISESHFSIHTWPEDGFVAMDIFTCGQMNPEKAIDVVREGFKATMLKKKIIERGY